MFPTAHAVVLFASPSSYHSQTARQPSVWQYVHPRWWHHDWHGPLTPKMRPCLCLAALRERPSFVACTRGVHWGASYIRRGRPLMRPVHLKQIIWLGDTTFPLPGWHARTQSQLEIGLQQGKGPTESAPTLDSRELRILRHEAEGACQPAIRQRTANFPGESIHLTIKDLGPKNQNNRYGL